MRSSTASRTVGAWFLSLMIAGPVSGQSDIEAEPAFPNLGFRRPVDLQHAGDGSGRLFVVEQEGRIFVFQNDQSVESKTVFLDIRDRVNDGGNEEGLLGLAFHPGYAENGYFFVYYSARGADCTSASSDRCSRVSRFGVGPDPDEAVRTSETLILEVAQPFSNHNGGQIRFGPDSLLYVSLGDGGAGGDPFDNGQSPETLLGSILRIDVNKSEEGRAYGIPADNPFVNASGRDEIYAYGFRNPWRFSFDAQTADLWAGDVGQNAVEEIDIVVKGGNYGWNIMEGDRCYPPSTSDCDTTGLEMPVWAYPQGSSTGRSVTGGFVYRGERVEGLGGTYVYADFVSGRIWGLTPKGDGTFENALIQDTGFLISSFGVDARDELYFCTFGGTIYRFRSNASTGSVGEDLPTPRHRIHESFPNPVSSTGTLVFSLDQGGLTRVELFDSLGRRVSTLLNGHLASGEHRLTFSGLGLDAGAYFYRLATSMGISTGKIVVL